MIGSVNRRDQRRFFRRGVSFSKRSAPPLSLECRCMDARPHRRAVDRKNNDTTKETVEIAAQTRAARAGGEAGAA